MREGGGLAPGPCSTGLARERKQGPKAKKNRPSGLLPGLQSRPNRAETVIGELFFFFIFKTIFNMDFEFKSNEIKTTPHNKTNAPACMQNMFPALYCI
jgi:hypothetical protein